MEKAPPNSLITPVSWVDIYRSLTFHGYDATSMHSHQVNGPTSQNNAITSLIPDPIPTFIDTVQDHTNNAIYIYRNSRDQQTWCFCTVNMHVSQWSLAYHVWNQSGLTTPPDCLNFPINQ